MASFLTVDCFVRGKLETLSKHTQEEAGFCFAYGASIRADDAICQDLAVGEVSAPHQCQEVCKACTGCWRYSFIANDAAIPTGTCRLGGLKALYVKDTPNSVSGPMQCEDPQKFGSTPWREYSVAGLCADMSIFPNADTDTTCQMACYADKECDVAQMASGTCFIGKGKKDCTGKEYQFSVEKMRSAKEAQQTKCDAAAGISKAQAKALSACAGDKDCESEVLQAAAEREGIQGADSGVAGEALALSQSSYVKFTCELLNMDLHCPDVNTGEKVGGFEDCKSGTKQAFLQVSEAFPVGKSKLNWKRLVPKLDSSFQLLKSNMSQEKEEKQESCTKADRIEALWSCVFCCLWLRVVCDGLWGSEAFSDQWMCEMQAMATGPWDIPQLDQMIRLGPY